MRILVAEDDSRLGPAIKQGLEDDGYAVDLVSDGGAAISAACSLPYDLLVLDVMLPEYSGFEVCSRVRGQGLVIPILFLTARSDVDDRVRGLDLGGDDYLTKPFAFREFQARVRALLRRESPTRTNEMRFGDIVLDARTCEVHRGDRLVNLTRKEYDLLEMFMRHPRQVLSRSMIVDHVWNADSENYSNVIDVYVRYLRRKLCEAGEPDVIQTVRGFGYQLKEPEP